MTVWQQLFTRRMLICVFTGFASGLPLYLLFNLVPAWLRSEQVDLKTIGLFALIQFPYTWKFLWSPLLDRYVVPVLGRRRGWMLLTQVGLLAGDRLAGRRSRPQTDLRTIAVLGTLLAFLSATQDIVLDAYRRELLSGRRAGPGQRGARQCLSHRRAGARFAVADPGRLPAVEHGVHHHRAVHAARHGDDADGAASRTAPRRPRRCAKRWSNRSTNSSRRKGWNSALLILAFLFFYKLGDSMCTALATPFYLDMGFSKTEIGLIAKNAGLWPAVIGGLLGGLWMVKIGINRALWLFGVVQVVSIFGFAWLASVGPPRRDRRAWNSPSSPWSSASKRSASGWAPPPSSPSSPAPPTPPTPPPSSRCSPASIGRAAHLRQCRHRLAGGDDGLGGILLAVRGAGDTGHAAAVEGRAVGRRPRAASTMSAPGRQPSGHE